MAKLLLIRNKKTPILDEIIDDVIEIDRKYVDEAIPGGDIDTEGVRGILICGEESLNHFGKKDAIRQAGKRFTINEVPAIILPDDEYIEQNPSYLEKYAEHINEAYGEVIKLTKYKNQTVLVEDAMEVWDVIEFIKTTGYCCFDFETYGVNPFKEDFRVVSMSLSFQQGSSYVLLLDHPEGLPEECIKKVFENFNDEVFGNPDIIKIGQNIKFDMHCAANMGVDKFYGRFHDTMVMGHLLDENTPNRMEYFIRQYYPGFAGYEKRLPSMDWDKVPVRDLVDYSGLDSDLALRLYWVFTDLLLQDKRLYNYFRNLAAPATKVLFKMERRGMLVNKEFLINSIEEVEGLIDEQMDELDSYPQVKKYKRYLGRVEAENQMVKHQKVIDKLKDRRDAYFKETDPKIKKKLQLTSLQEEKLNDAGDYKRKFDEGYVANVDVNFNSQKQLVTLMYTDKGFNLKPHKDWDGNPIYSTNKDILEYVKDKSGFLDSIKIYRQLSKINSTYLKPILKLMDKDHKIHTKFNQHITKTGRLSSSDPNLQNVISRTKYKKVERAVSLVKKSFTPPENHNIVQLDFSQAELRIIAHYAQEDTMLKAYKEGKDLHALTAASSRGMSLEEWLEQDDKTKKQQRFEAKAVNFGFIYLMSVKGFQDYAKTAYGITLTEKQSDKYQKSFFKLYPKLPQYHKMYIKKALKFGYVRTFFGRRVRLVDIYSLNKFKKGHAERNAVNSPIQGTAGEYTILGLIILDNRMPELEIVNSIHDSVIPYIQDDVLHESIKEAKEHLQKIPIELYFGKSLDSVNMKVDAEASKKSWGDLEEI